MDYRTIEFERFKIKITWEHDPFPDASYLGKFTDSLSGYTGLYIDTRDKTLERYTGKGSYEVIQRVDVTAEEQGYGYFYVPMNYQNFSYKDWKHVSPEGIRETVRQYGSLRQAEYHYIQEGYKRLSAFYAGEWHMLGCIVKLWLDESQIASESLWCIESDADDMYKREIEQELLSEAISRLNKLTNALPIHNFPALAELE